MGINASKDQYDENGSHEAIPSKSQGGSSKFSSDSRKKNNQSPSKFTPAIHNVPSSTFEPDTSAQDEDTVPTVFKWEHGGKNVFIAGTFNNWEKTPMHRSGNDFSYIQNISKGKHVFKFIVDDSWRCAPDLPSITDSEGRMNNFIDVFDFQPYDGDDKYFEKSKEQKLGDSEFQQHIPDLDDYTKEPPSLPPHLRHIILNKPPPAADQMSLPVPHHVSLNHLYCTAIKDNMMVLGSTHRYKEKFCTVVFFAMMPSPAN